MPTLLLGQCDSSISVCPDVFDRLIANDIKAEQYYADKIYLQAQNQNLNFRLEESGKLQKIANDNYAIAGEKLKYMTNLYSLSEADNRKKDKQIIRLKAGIFVVGIVGLTGTTYFAIKQLF